MSHTYCLPLYACAALMAVNSVQASDAVPAKETLVLQRVAVPGTDRQMGMGIAWFPPFAVKPRHKATGPELCYVLEGEVKVRIEGAQDKVYRAGETFQLPAGVMHVTSAGAAGAKVLATWVWVPGQPFNVAAPTH